MQLHSYRLRKLEADHRVEDFDCGAHQQDKFIRRALEEQESGANTTHVLSPREDPNCVAGFFCLSPGSRDRETSPKAMRKKLPNRYPTLGYIHLGQIARDKDCTPPGFGREVMTCAQLVTLEVADLVGGAALTLFAGSGELAAYYQTLGFTRIGDSTECFLRLDDLRDSLPDGVSWSDELTKLRA